MISVATLKTLEDYIRAIPNMRDDSFANSVAYYALTGRRGAWICEDKEAKTVICHHPNQDNHLLIFPEIGNGRGHLTADILRHLDLSRKTVQLARFHKKEIQRVKDCSKNTPSLKLTMAEEKYLDWQYPIHILDTERVTNLEGASFRNIRQKIRKINDVDIEMISIHDDNALTYLKACTKYWEGNQILYNKDYQPDQNDFYQNLFNLIESYPSLFDGFIIKYGNRMSGFSIWDTTEKETTNLIANLVDIHHQGLSEYQLVMACRLLHEKGIRFLNRGGSERKGLNDFKEKFSPVKSIKLYSAFVENQTKQNFSFSSLIEQPKPYISPIFS